MHVLHLTRDFPPAHCGGITTAVAGLVRALASLGLRASVVSLERRRGLDDDRALALDWVSATRIGDADDGANAARRLVRGDRVDLVHLHEPMLGEAAVALARAHDAPLITTIHVDYGELAARRALSPATLGLVRQQRVMRSAERIVVPSASAADGIRQREPEVADRVVVVPHGVDVGEGSPICSEREALVVYIGRFDDTKGTQDFVEAVTQVLAGRPQARAIVAGGLPSHPRMERRWRRRWDDGLATAAAVRDRIEVTGWLQTEAIDELLDRAGVVAIPSRYETFGMVALEAMARAAPIVATRAGGLIDLLDDETALLVPPGDRRALAESIAALLDDPERGRRLGRQARAVAATRFSWAQAGQQMQRTYAAVLRR